LAASRSKIVFNMFEYIEVDLARVMPNGYSLLGNSLPTDSVYHTPYLHDVSPAGTARWQVMGNDEYVQLALGTMQTHFMSKAEHLAGAAPKFKTELGTGIYRRCFQLLDAQMEALDAASQDMREALKPQVAVPPKRSSSP
jgi:hypothetical protein